MREYGGERRWKQKYWKGYLIILIHILLRKSVCQNYIRGIAQHEVMSAPSAHEAGTEILFRPDRAVFREKRISVDKIREWVWEKTGERSTPVIQVRKED